MKRLLTLLLAALLLTGCRGTICPPLKVEDTPPESHTICPTPPPDMVAPGADAPTRDYTIAHFLNENTALLYDEDGALYTLGITDLLITAQDERVLSPDDLAVGQRVSIFFDGGIGLSYPGFFVEPTKLIVQEASTNLLGLYLQLFDELWEMDSGINDGISVLAFDFGSPFYQLLLTPPVERSYALTQAQKNALFFILSSRLGYEVFESDFETLCADGYIIEEESGFCHFPSGLLFELKVEEECADGFQLVISKWRSSLGAILTHGEASCIDGRWSYTLAPFAIA